jgi:uncharacterized membrane protein
MKDFLQGRWLRHPLHPVLAHVPTALWPSSLVFDILANLGVGGNAMYQTSFYAMLFGLLVALLAIPAGLADWLDIKRDRPAWKLGLYHLILNLLVTVLWAINLVMRWGTLNTASAVPLPLLALSVLATLMLVASGYLGGLMVYDYGISVARLSKDKWRRIAEAGGANVPQPQQ